ncbi:MAG: SHOCT domain-containing protein [Paenibacillaceae bacterium]
MNWFGMLIPFILIVGIILLIIYLLKRDDATGRKSTKNGAEAILAERFARGEIAQEEYEQMKEVLRK